MLKMGRQLNLINHDSHRLMSKILIRLIEEKIALRGLLLRSYELDLRNLAPHSSGDVKLTLQLEISKIAKKLFVGPENPLESYPIFQQFFQPEIVFAGADAIYPDGFC